jgi:hypothetical protein
MKKWNNKATHYYFYVFKQFIITFISYTSRSPPFHRGPCCWECWLLLPYRMRRISEICTRSLPPTTAKCIGQVERVPCSPPLTGFPPIISCSKQYSLFAVVITGLVAHTLECASPTHHILCIYDINSPELCSPSVDMPGSYLIQWGASSSNPSGLDTEFAQAISLSFLFLCEHCRCFLMPTSHPWSSVTTSP